MNNSDIQGSTKVIGYFAYTASGYVLCEGEACVIASTEERMQIYIKRANDGVRYIVKKTRFFEIGNGLRQKGAYAFDEESYGRFFDLAKMNGMDSLLPGKEVFLRNRPADGIQFVIIRTQ